MAIQPANLIIDASANGMTLTITHKGKTLICAAIFDARTEIDGMVEIRQKNNNQTFYKERYDQIRFGGTVYDTAQECVEALNAVIGAAFRSAGGTAIQPDMRNYYNKTEVDNLLGAQALAVGTLITNEQTVRQQNDATLQANKVDKEISSLTDTTTTINHDGTYVENQWAKQDGSAYTNVGATASGAYMSAADAAGSAKVSVRPNDAALKINGTRAALNADSIMRKSEVDAALAASTTTMYLHLLTLKSTDTTITLQYINNSATPMTWADMMAMLPQNGSSVNFMYPCSGKSAAGMVFAMYHYHYRWDNWVNMVVVDPATMTESIVTLAEADFTIYDWVNTIQL